MPSIMAAAHTTPLDVKRLSCLGYTTKTLHYMLSSSLVNWIRCHGLEWPELFVASSHSGYRRFISVHAIQVDADAESTSHPGNSVPATSKSDHARGTAILSAWTRHTLASDQGIPLLAGLLRLCSFLGHSCRTTDCPVQTRKKCFLFFLTPFLSKEKHGRHHPRAPRIDPPDSSGYVAGAPHFSAWYR